MIVYHGTTLTIEKPMIIKGELGRDFGFGFYTTNIREQAERWALRRAKMALRKKKNIEGAIVNIYDWKHDSNLNIKQFIGTSMDWLEFVVKCRADSNYKHGYDVVEGKIANDNVGETVSYVVQGIMRPEDAIERLRFEEINNQIAFCSNVAIDSLSFIESYEVGKK